MPSIFTSTKVFNRPIDHQSTSNDRLKPVMTTGLVNMHINRSIANLEITTNRANMNQNLLTENQCTLSLFTPVHGILVLLLLASNCLMTFIYVNT